MQILNAEGQNAGMRWFLAYIVALFVTLALLMQFMTYGIGGCDCGPDDKGVFCWLCEHQLVYVAFATSPLWVVVLLNLRANMRKHRVDLYGEDGPRQN
jgi:amino acid transporter